MDRGWIAGVVVERESETKNGTTLQIDFAKTNSTLSTPPPRTLTAAGLCVAESTDRADSAAREPSHSTGVEIQNSG